MSTRAMVFIDGTWLAVTTNRLADQHGVLGRTGGPLDFGALPRVCAQAIASQMALSSGIDVVRTHYFGSIATNYDLQDQDAVQRRSEFFDSLRRHHRYEVFRYETDYRGHRVRRTPGEEGYTPPEKAVDVGLATSLLEMAAVSAYDIAIVVCGDRDFVPALQAVRRLGKRVAVVSARGSCARELSDPNDPVRIRDFEVLWLDQLWAQVVSPAARPSPRAVADEVSPVAEAVASESSDDSPYADFTMSFAAEAVANDEPASSEASAGPVVEGVVTKVHAHGYGFVRADDGLDYYFRRADFTDPNLFSRLERYRSRVAFRVCEASRSGQAGRAVTLSLLGMTEAPVMVARSAMPNDTPTREQTPREAWTPRSSPTVASVPETTGDLWADDPFAAPKRRVDAAAQEAVTVSVAADVALVPDAVVLATSAVAPEPELTPPTIEAPVKKRRAPARKTASA
ncbi:NYN domain-containing protein [Gemmatimonas sp.]|uniref:NYN domain-containing protein n=1 Tax=Gemmatimonas sp. TaxID=1962908 RepID=UPI0037C15C54